MPSIQHKRTTTSNTQPNTTQIAVGELALNLPDKRLYTSNGTIVIDLNRARPRRTIITSSATPTANYDTEDKLFITALAVDATFGAPTGTPEGGSLLLFRIKDNGVSRALTWNAVFRTSLWLPLPTATTVGKTMVVGFIYNEIDSKWDLLAMIDGL